MSEPAKCPMCGAEVKLSNDAEAGELLDCGECDSELELVTVDPPELKEAPQEEEDWGE